MEDDQAMGESGLSEYNKVVITKNTETVGAYSSHVIPMKAEKACTGGRINVMTQALWVEDRSLPQGLTMQNAYTELRTGSKNAVVVVRNSTAYPKSLKKNHLNSSEYHDVFPLKLGELGCTHSTKYVIKVTDDTPFKERFRWIPLPLVEEVHNHLWEMLE